MVDDSKLAFDLKLAFDAFHEGVGIVDSDQNLVYANNALMKLHGISLEQKSQILGQSWQFLYNEKGRHEITDNIMLDVEINGYWRGRRKVKRHDGKVIFAELSITSLPDGGMVGTMRDVSEEQKALEERASLQLQLSQAQKMEAIGRLAGGIAHDFNNILAAMNGYAEFLTEDLEEGSDTHQFAENILQAGLQAKSLVDQILVFSRANKESALRTIDLVKPVSEAFAMLHASVPRSIELTLNIAHEEVPVRANATQIGQMVMNFGVNARDAMDSKDQIGEVEVALDVMNSSERYDFKHQGDELPDASELPVLEIQSVDSSHTRLYLNHLKQDTDYAVLSIRDTGSGMSRVILEHVFEPFFTTKSVDKGTGLGLATIHGIVVSHHGALLIDTKIGEGTTFDVFFPLDQAVSQEQEEDLKVSEEGLSGYILFVEDQSEVAGVILKMLERAGLQADYAANGLEAMHMIKANPDRYDLVLTDHNMPKMTGFELIKRIHEDIPDLPFVVLSGYKEEELDPMMFEHKAVHAVLSKPIARAELEKELGKVLRWSRQNRRAV